VETWGERVKSMKQSPKISAENWHGKTESHFEQMLMTMMAMTTKTR